MTTTTEDLAALVPTAWTPWSTVLASLVAAGPSTPNRRSVAEGRLTELKDHGQVITSINRAAGQVFVRRAPA